MSKTDISLTCEGVALCEDSRGLIEKRSNYLGLDMKERTLTQSKINTRTLNSPLPVL